MASPASLKTSQQAEPTDGRPCLGRDCPLVCSLRYPRTRAPAISTILLDSCPDIMELFMGLLTLLWALTCFISGDLFTLPGFEVLGRVFHEEWKLGLVFLATGLARLVALFSGHLTFRKSVAFWGCLLWLFMFAVLIARGLQIPATLTSALLAVTSMWIYWRLPGRDG